jgi:hypothetical protein
MRYYLAPVCFACVAVWFSPAAIPRPAIVKASEVGASLDSNLATGGGHDDTLILQNVLDRAKSGHAVQLVIDGPALVSGLNVYGHTTIECTAGAGLYLKDNANRAMLRNGNRSRGKILDTNIVIRGCLLNGNRDNQRIGGPMLLGRYSPVEEDGKTPQSGIQFFGVQHLVLEDLSLIHIRSFGIWIANAKYIHLDKITVDTGLPPYPYTGSLAEQRAYVNKGVNDDGIHFNGPIQYLLAERLKLRTIDDAFALNANDGSYDDMTINDEIGPYVGQGPITDVTVRDVTFMESHEGIRLLSRDQKIDRILFEDLKGSVRERVVLLSHFATTQHTGDYGSLTFKNVAVNPIAGPEYLETYPWLRDFFLNSPNHWDVVEDAKRPVFALNSPIKNLVLNNVSVKVVDKRPLIWVGPDAVIDDLSADIDVDDPAGDGIPVELVGHVKHFDFHLNWRGKSPIQDEGGKIDNLVWRDKR